MKFILQCQSHSNHFTSVAGRMLLVCDLRLELQLLVFDVLDTDIRGPMDVHCLFVPNVDIERVAASD